MFDKLKEILISDIYEKLEYAWNIKKEIENLNNKLKSYSLEETKDNCFNWYYVTKIFLLYEIFNQVNEKIKLENEMKHTK